jgi:hypothetical protein
MHSSLNLMGRWQCKILRDLTVFKNLVAILAHHRRKVRAHCSAYLLAFTHCQTFFWVPKLHRCKIPSGPALPPSHEAKGGVDLAKNAGDSPLFAITLFVCYPLYY